MSPIELDLLYARPLGSRYGYADLKSAGYRRHLENLLLRASVSSYINLFRNLSVKFTTP